MDSTLVTAIVAVAFIAIAIIGMIKKIKNYGISGVIADVTGNEELERYVLDKIGDALDKAGITGTYEEFKTNIEMFIVDQIRNATDEIGGVVDVVADTASDEDLINIINKILEVSDAEDEIKAAYDKLVSNRIEEIDKSEAEEAEKNEILETENLDKYEIPENESEPELQSIDTKEENS